MSYRKFPIRLYKKEDGSIYYDAKFMNGTAKDLNTAFSDIQKQDLDWNLIYFYDDVVDVQFGSFIPAIRNKKYKGMTYLGQIDLSLKIDTAWGKGEHSVTHLTQHPEDIPKQEAFIKKLKAELKRQEVIKSIKNGLKKMVNFIKPNTFVIDEILEVIKRAES